MELIFVSRTAGCRQTRALTSTAKPFGDILIDQLEASYENRKAVIGVVGLGYVGLPLALAAAAAGYRVVGFDIDPQKIEKLGRGESYLKHIGSDSIAMAMRNGTLRATVDFAEMKNVDAIVICVPTPLTRNREPDLSFVEGTALAIAPHLRKGHLVVLEINHLAGHDRRGC